MMEDIQGYFRHVWNEERCRKNVGLGHQTRPYFAEPSWLRHKNWYVFWRIAVALYLTCWCFLSAFLDSDWYNRPANRIKYFIFFSDWNFLLMALTANLQLFIAWKFRSDHQYSSVADTTTDGAGLYWYEKCTWLLYTITTDSALIVSTFFWVFLYKGNHVSVVTIHLHILNSVYVLLDLFVNAIPIRLLHGVYTMAYGTVYITFVIVYKLCGGTNAQDQEYIYWILDWDYPLRALFFTVLGILSAVPAHLVIFLLYKLRQKLSSEKDHDALPLLDA